MPSDLESDLIEILKGTMKADMGIYRSRCLDLPSYEGNKDVLQLFDDALAALNSVNTNASRKEVQQNLLEVGRKLFRSPPSKNDLNDESWNRWALESNLGCSCLAQILPNLVIGLSEWLCSAAYKRDDSSYHILSLWAKYNWALAYKETEGGIDETEKKLKEILDLKSYPDFHESDGQLFSTARAAVKWPAIIQVCEIHRDRQEKTRFDQRKHELLRILSPHLTCDSRDCSEEDCVLLSKMNIQGAGSENLYRSYIARYLFWVCQEYQVLSMRAACRAEAKVAKKIHIIFLHGQRIKGAIRKIQNRAYLNNLENKLYLLSLQYINESLLSIEDTISKIEDQNILKKMISPWKTIVDFVYKIEKKDPERARRLFPERFEYWPKILKIANSKTGRNRLLEPLINVLVLRDQDGVDELNQWIMYKLRSFIEEKSRNPLKNIKKQINVESMKPEDYYDPEVEEQLRLYREVVGRFNDGVYGNSDGKKSSNGDLVSLEKALIKGFICGKQLDQVDRWFAAGLCARKRFLEKNRGKRCYNGKKCSLWRSEIGIEWEGLGKTVKKIFGRKGGGRYRLSHLYLDEVFKGKAEEFKSRLCFHSRHEKMRNRFGLACLRRWQSFTPALSAPQKVSRGGGYFIFKCNDKGDVEKGVVIDPGLYFLENFIGEGFSIQDIDAVLLTHHHLDHRDDLESILTLIHEAQEEKASKNIKLVVTSGAWPDIGSMIRRSRPYIEDIYTIEKKSLQRDIRGKYDPISIEWKPAYHNCFDDDSVGYRLWLGIGNGRKKAFRFTGDTLYPPPGLEIAPGDRVILLNIGGLVSDNDEGRTGEWTLTRIAAGCDKEDDICDWILETSFLENHLYLGGTLQLLDNWKARVKKGGLAVLCELPEELSGGHRSTIAKAIEKAINHDDKENRGPNQESNGTKSRHPIKKKIVVLPEDVGLRISYSTDPKDEDPKIECLYCSQLLPPDEIEVITWGLEERLMFVCRNCKKAAAPYLLEEKFKEYRDRGRPFEKAES